MKINTLIVDDDPSWRQTLSEYVALMPILNLVDTCPSAMEAYAHLAEDKIDLLICDVEMPLLTGLGLAWTLAERFIRSIERVRQRLLTNPESIPIAPYFFIRENHDYVQIPFNDVLYIRAQDHFLQVVPPENLPAHALP